MNEKRSLHAQEYNHDPQASTYDEDVIDETNHIRNGYKKTLVTVANSVNARENASVLELGSGTGNLTCLLDHYKRIVCVDISRKMQEIAREKLAHSPNVEFEVCDILEYCSQAEEAEVVASTYALHHLTDEEKKVLLSHLCRALPPEGLIVIGDLMFKDPLSREQVLEDFMAGGLHELVADIESEFFWDVTEACGYISSLGFTVSFEQTGMLSWVVSARKG